MLNVHYINPFIKSCSDIFKQVTNTEIHTGKLFVKQGMVPLMNVSVTIGVLGSKIKGNFHLNLSKDTTIKIVSAMMGGYSVTELDEMTTSAISELSNMIAGHASMYFSEEAININITPPDVTIHEEYSKRNYIKQTVCVPLELTIGGTVELDIALYEE